MGAEAETGSALCGGHDGAQHLHLSKPGGLGGLCMSVGGACHPPLLPRRACLLSRWHIKLLSCPCFHVSSRGFTGTDVGQAGGSACCSPAAHCPARSFSSASAFQIQSSYRAVKPTCGQSEMTATAHRAETENCKPAATTSGVALRGHIAPLSRGFLAGEDELTEKSRLKRQLRG